MPNTFKSAAAASIGTGDITLYTAPAGVTAVVIGLVLSNVTGSQIKATVKRAGEKYLPDIPIPANSAFSGLDGKIILMPGASIVVASDTASSVNAWIEVLEQS